MIFKKRITIVNDGKVSDDIGEAGQKATNFVTEVSNDGIWVTPSNAKPQNGQPVSTTRGWHIADAIEMFIGTASYIKAWVENSVAKLRVGRADSGHVLMQSSGVDLYGGDGTVNLAHFGYDDGTSRTGTAVAPYYTLGTRTSGNSVGNWSASVGKDGVASGFESFSQGGSKATNEWAVAMGGMTQADGKCSVALGAGTRATSYGQTVIGTFNQTLSTDQPNQRGTYALIIGNGNGSSPYIYGNCATVKWTGDAWIAGTLTQGSDKRLKEHLSYLDEDAAAFIRKLKPARYIKDDAPHLGFYAQDVQEIDTWDCMVGEDDNGYLTLGYTEIIAPLVAYCQSLERRIEELEKR